MLSRRDFLMISAATAALVGGDARMRSLAASQALTQEDLLGFDPLGQVTIVHLTDVHAQLTPMYFREPDVNLGVGEAVGQPPHITGDAFLERYEVEAGSPLAYMLTPVDYTALAREYGRVGGIDRIATLVKAIRAARPDNTLFVDGGDFWQGSWPALASKGGDMVRVMNALGVEATTGHWEFTYGQERVEELIAALDCPFLAGNVRDTTWEEPVFESTKMYERGGVQIAVIGQAFPYTPVANPRYMMPDWSFGIREAEVRASVEAARANGARVVVLLSHNGFDVDRKMASRVEGIDVILTGHSHDVLPVPLVVNGTLLIASGSGGKFLTRIDLDVGPDGVRDYRTQLIPVLSDAIAPDPEMAELVRSIRALHEALMSEVVGQTESLLYRRGNFNGTFDDLICQALLEQRDAEIALSPGFRWGPTLLPGQDITREDIFDITAITYPEVYRTEMTGDTLKIILEDVSDNLFNPDPYYQQGGDMVRVGGLGYRIEPRGERGQRVSEMVHLASGEAIDPGKTYVVAGWASVNEGVEGPPVWDIVGDYVSANGTVAVKPNDSIEVVS